MPHKKTPPAGTGGKRKARRLGGFQRRGIVPQLTLGIEICHTDFNPSPRKNQYLTSKTNQLPSLFGLKAQAERQIQAACDSTWPAAGVCYAL